MRQLNWIQIKKFFWQIGLLLFILAIPSVGWSLTAREIMDKVEAREKGDNAVLDMQMILIDKQGKQRERIVRSYRKKKDTNDYSIIFFESPADVKGTGFLTHDYKDPQQNDDQWLYLPALRKIKRIAAGDKSGSFMGSDFNYSDLASRNLDNYEFTLLKEDEVRGKKVWQIKSVPKSDQEIEETGYTQSIAFVQQDNFVVVRSVAWVNNKKYLRYMDIKKLELVDNVWVAAEMQMTTKEGQTTIHQTNLIQKNILFNQNLDDELFTTRQLEKGL